MRKTSSTARQRRDSRIPPTPLRFVRALWVLCCCVVTSCGLWLPDAVPYPEQPIAPQTTQRVAAILVDGPAQPFLTPWVVLSPSAPPVFATARLPVTVAAGRGAQVPWREEGGVRYAPVIVTLNRDTQGELRIDAIETTIREQTVANHDTQRIVRLIGTLQPRDGALVLVDRRQKSAFLPFVHPLVPSSPSLVVARSSLQLGDELLVEGVVSQDRLIPLVFAPVFAVLP